jgi:hypothetical protein
MQGQEPVLPMLDELLELKDALEREWPERQAALRASGALLNDGDDKPDDKPADDKPADKPEDKPADDKPADKPEDKPADKPADDKPADKPAKPPWGDGDFDPDRAWQLIQNAREAEKAAKKEAADARSKAKEFEDKDKTEAEKLRERAETAEKELESAKRNSLVAEVALDKGLTPAQAKRLVGTTKEELEADADELLESFKTEDSGGQAPTGRPREKLRSGAVPNANENDGLSPKELADKVPKRY